MAKHQISIRIDDTASERLAALLERVSAAGLEATQGVVYRMAMMRGLEALESEYPPPPKKRKR